MAIPKEYLDSEFDFGFTTEDTQEIINTHAASAADYQAKLACLEILGKYERPKDMHAAVDYELKNRHFDFGPGQRHAMEVDFHTFREELKKELKKAGVDIGKPPVGNPKRYKDFSRVT